MYDKILDWSKLRATTDNIMDASQKLKFDWESIENIVGKEENAGTSIFSISHVFKSPLLQVC